MIPHSLWEMCWFKHKWGGWLGSECQPILTRRCQHCHATETKPDEERIKWLEANTIPFDEFMKDFKNE